MTEELRATAEGTARYASRVKDTVAKGHFRSLQNLLASSIGIGTYLGAHDESTDERYRDAIIRAVELGCNVIDTAVNYRFQRSERSIREALSTLFKDKKARRDEIIVATKGGFLTFDGAPPSNPPAYFAQTFVETGILKSEDIVAGCHSMSPRYIAHQIDCSRENLGLKCIDIYYLHNPEMQLEELSKKEFYSRLLLAFERLEKSVSEGKIQMYGTATWEGYRARPEAHNYLSLEDIVQLAETVGGENHHFKVVQLPYNLAMPEAFTLKNQQVNGKLFSVLEAANNLGITVVASASILQSRLAKNLPDLVRDKIAGLDTDAQRAIQFVRSTPGICVALIGMSNIRHVEENLRVATVPSLPQEQLLQLYSK